jgi:hypothetical protein
MTWGIVLTIPAVGLLLYCTRRYAINIYKFDSFIGSPMGNYKIRDRNRLLTFLLQGWGIYFLPAVMSFQIFWFLTIPLWVIIFVVQKKLLALWEYHGYSRKVFIFLNGAVVI